MASPTRSRADPRLESSNSTASIFLGGVRRTWMPNSSHPNPAATLSSKRPEHCSIPTPTSEHQSKAASAQIDRDRPAVPSGTTTSQTLMSPVTPGANLQLQQNQPCHPTIISTPSTSHSPTTALPSPVPSTNSHASPAKNSHGPTNRATPAPQASTRPAPTTPRTNGEIWPPQPSSQNASQPQFQASGNITTRPGQQEDNTTSVPQPANGSAQLALSKQLSKHQTLSPLSEHVWQLWIKNLQIMREGLEVRGELSPEYGVPRMSVLHQACQKQDLFFIVLHQMYCVRTVDPYLYDRIPELRGTHCQEGMLLLQDLLVDNLTLPLRSVEAWAQFPCPAQDLMPLDGYNLMIQKIPCVLTRLVTDWRPLYRACYERRYPPLVEELVLIFETTSHAFLSTIFVSLCRELYEPSYQQQLGHIFCRDYLALERRIANGEALNSQERNAPFIKSYLKLPISSRALHPINWTPGFSRGQVPIVYQTVQVASMLSPSIMSPTSGNGQSSVASPQLPAPNSPYGLSHQRPGIAQPVSHGQPYHSPYHQVLPSHPASSQPVPTYAVPPSIPQYDGAGGSRPLLQTQASQPPRATQWDPVVQQRRPPAAVGRVPGSGLPHPLPSRPTVPSPHHAPSQQSPPSQYHAPPQRPTPSQQPATRQAAVPQQHPPRTDRRTSGQQSQPRRGTSLLPPAGYKPSQTAHPNPLRFGLHQAHLRDPVKKLVERNASEELVDTKLFQYLGGFVLNPTFLETPKTCHKWTFQLSNAQCRRFPPTVSQGEGKRPLRTFQSGCWTFRLRSIKMPPSRKPEVEQVWASAKTTWPSVFYIFVNDQELFARRKLHNGKDLPLDITDYLTEGVNKITLNLLLDKYECKTQQYAFAVEVMEVTGYMQLRSRVPSLPAAESRALIQKRLSPITDDEEITVITDSLTVSLIDPFSARIVDVPARSRQCDHLDCFDLETFLSTRKSASDSLPMNDNWFCPICKADARPQVLFIDGFFAEVLQEITRQKRREDAQAIEIKIDGSWNLKVVSDENSRDSSGDPVQRPTLKRKADSSPGAGDARSGSRGVLKHEGSPTPSPFVVHKEPDVIEID
ncbi:hypothetical protein N7510_011460 [Penicillium lagena]|uniref:uncharacterized protein n=1 Tax=Penicillium lagena TaxID=94218 RepID=UPI0025406AE2|nr:uncharacterized protein N7510_011460 [Penicillium lagena]KAJ5601926.1 hypothetical protein N7510_011460 [Penicillium lagena]